jgi:hypothetical protein
VHNIAAILAQIAPGELKDLVDEVGDKNQVLVRVDRASVLGKRTVYKRKDREILDAKQVLTNAFLAHHDRLRALAGKPMLYLPEAVARCGGELISVGSNLRTTVGQDYTSVQLGGAASTTVAKWIAVSANTNAPNAANTSANTTSTRVCWGTAQANNTGNPGTTAGEITYGGAARTAGVYNHTNGTNTYTQGVTYTASATITSLQVAGLFDSATQGAGTLFFETTFTATSLNSGDQLTLTWTITA